MTEDCRLFVYGSLLQGEPDHGLLGGVSPLRLAATEPTFQLFDLGAYAALVPGGSTSIRGEIYIVSRERRAQIDVRREVPILFQRAVVKLADGESAETYVMTRDQVRGRRRIHSGDWRARFSSNTPRVASGPFVQWARGRFSKR